MNASIACAKLEVDVNECQWQRAAAWRGMKHVTVTANEDNAGNDLRLTWTVMHDMAPDALKIAFVHPDLGIGMLLISCARFS